MSLKYQIYGLQNCLCSERLLVVNREQVKDPNFLNCDACFAPRGNPSDLYMCCNTCFQLSWPGFSGANDTLIGTSAVDGQPLNTWFSTNTSLGSVASKNVLLGTTWQSAPNSFVLTGPCNNSATVCTYPATNTSDVVYQPATMLLPSISIPDIWAKIQVSPLWCSDTQQIAFARLGIVTTTVWPWTEAGWPTGPKAMQWNTALSHEPPGSLSYSQFNVYWSEDWTCNGGTFFIPPDGYVSNVTGAGSPTYTTSSNESTAFFGVPSWTTSAGTNVGRFGSAGLNTAFFTGWGTWPSTITISPTSCSSNTFYTPIT